MRHIANICGFALLAAIMVAVPAGSPGVVNAEETKKGGVIHSHGFDVTLPAGFEETSQGRYVQLDAAGEFLSFIFVSFSTIEADRIKKDNFISRYAEDAVNDLREEDPTATVGAAEPFKGHKNPAYRSLVSATTEELGPLSIRLYYILDLPRCRVADVQVGQRQGAKHDWDTIAGSIVFTNRFANGVFSLMQPDGYVYDESDDELEVWRKGGTSEASAYKITMEGEYFGSSIQIIQNDDGTVSLIKSDPEKSKKEFMERGDKLLESYKAGFSDTKATAVEDTANYPIGPAKTFSGKATMAGVSKAFRGVFGIHDNYGIFFMAFYPASEKSDPLADFLKVFEWSASGAGSSGPKSPTGVTGDLVPRVCGGFSVALPEGFKEEMNEVGRATFLLAGEGGTGERAMFAAHSYRPKKKAKNDGDALVEFTETVKKDLKNLGIKVGKAEQVKGTTHLCSLSTGTTKDLAGATMKVLVYCLLDAKAKLGASIVVTSPASSRTAWQDIIMSFQFSPQVTTDKFSFKAPDGCTLAGFDPMTWRKTEGKDGKDVTELSLKSWHMDDIDGQTVEELAAHAKEAIEEYFKAVDYKGKVGDFKAGGDCGWEGSHSVSGTANDKGVARKFAAVISVKDGIGMMALAVYPSKAKDSPLKAFAAGLQWKEKK